MKITRDVARRIAELAHLEFDDAALDRLASEMTKILAYIETLPADDAPVRTPAPHGSRDEVPAPPVPIVQPDIARNAPDFEDGFFVVPKVIE